MILKTCLLLLGLQGILALQPYTLEEFLQGTFVNKGFNGTWVSDKKILYRKIDENYYSFDVTSNTTQLVLNKDVLNGYKNPKVIMSPNEILVLIKYDEKTIFRHSHSAKYAVYDINSKVTNNVRNGVDLQYCAWTPDNKLVFVEGNNIFHWQVDNSLLKKITNNGENGVFYNGIPDWVYEEEVLSSGSAIWMSPSGQYIAYLTLDDTNVKTFSFDTYGDPGDLNSQYPKVNSIRYPKVNHKNPEYTFNIYDVKYSKLVAKHLPKNEENIFYGAVWRTENDIVIIETDRTQTGIIYNYLNVLNPLSKETQVYSNLQSKTWGWVIVNMPVYLSDGSNYAQINNTINNFTQVCYALHGLKNNRCGTSTKQDREALSIYGIDENNQFIYYSGTLKEKHSQQHVYRFDYGNTNNDTCLTCNFETPSGTCQYAQAMFNKKMDFMVRICQGPGPNYIDIVNLKTKAVYVWETNNVLRSDLTNKAKPTVKDIRARIGNTNEYDTDIRLLLPPNMEENKKYPLIVNVYAGPGSNQIKDAFSLGFENYVTTNLSYIYAYVDGRGSGRRGSKILYSVYRKLGTYEVLDQIAAAKYLQNNYKFIDANRTGIWGWSYGGFSTLLALAGDKENVFKCGISVAPVTNFIYYDSIYTERYMGLAIGADNLPGYWETDVTRRVKDLDGKNLLLIHGNADDNVHYQQSMLLVKAMEKADVQFDQMSYPDEDHSLKNVSPHLYHTMTNFWKRHFGPTAGVPSSSTSFTISSCITLFAMIMHLQNNIF